jgi:CheY-like chemotaxis protein
MTEEVRARAIEPFYTTKPTGQGTGLGLSQVYAVARESGGTLTIDSEPGRGTTVRMMLPAGAPPLVRTDTKAPHPTTVPGAQSREQTRVLVVDDDKLVRRFMAESLRSLRYHVTEAESGAQALATMERERFDLLVVDFAMPGMNGADAARAAQDQGFSDRVQVEDAAICEAVQRGLASGSYEAGRLNPKREQGLKHFHDLLRAAYRAALGENAHG